MVTEASKDKEISIEDSDAESVEEDNQEVESDDQYELLRPEGKIISPSEWKKRFMKAQTNEEIRSQLAAIKPFRRCETTGRIIATTSLNNVFEGVCDYLNGGVKINQKDLINMAQEVFGSCDLLFGISSQLVKKISSYENENTWANLYTFLKATPHPKSKIIPRFFRQKYHYLKNQPRAKLISCYESLWLQLMSSKIPKKLLLRFLPYISSDVLQNLREPHRTADFFFRTFELGSSFSILSLEAIFRLIVDHNFEYPNFFDKVYTLCTPSLFYTEQKQKFIELLNIFLSSTHVPLYIVAAFAKRLMQILLVAPLDAQEPVMGLVRNLITRHPSISPLIHREIPESRPEDPYKSNEVLSKSNALDSSLWELRTLKRHWHSNVMKRANFADKAMQQTESFVRFRCLDEYFAMMMAKKFGDESDSQQEKYEKAQDGSDEEDEPQPKKGKENKKGKFTKKHNIAESKTIPINFSLPNGQFLPGNSFNFEYSDYFQV